MILGYHVIFSAYGFWLPNDPRGSWSDFVGAWELVKFGRATKTDIRRSVAAAPHNWAEREEAKRALKHPPVLFTGEQARVVGVASGHHMDKAGVPVWACSILPDHVHLVIGRPRSKVEQLIIQLKGAATRDLVARDMHPLKAHRTKSGRPPKAFARGEWKVYLDSPADLRRAIAYVEANPAKEHKPRQNWSFVTPCPYLPV